MGDRKAAYDHADPDRYPQLWAHQPREPGGLPQLSAATKSAEKVVNTMSSQAGGGYHEDLRPRGRGGAGFPPGSSGMRP
jgi:hypothetical protein